LTGALGKVGPAYMRDEEGEGMSVYLPDSGDKIKRIRPAPPSTPVPTGSK
jgi:hypothetical protein